MTPQHLSTNTNGILPFSLTALVLNRNDWQPESVQKGGDSQVRIWASFTLAIARLAKKRSAGSPGASFLTLIHTKIKSIRQLLIVVLRQVAISWKKNQSNGVQLGALWVDTPYSCLILSRLMGVSGHAKFASFAPNYPKKMFNQVSKHTPGY